MGTRRARKGLPHRCQRRIAQTSPDKVRGGATLSPGGKFILWYEQKDRNWYTYEIATGVTHNITPAIRVPLYDEEDDHPDDPPAHGSMGWLDNDRFVYIYDKYDIWQCDPSGITAPVNLTRGPAAVIS